MNFRHSIIKSCISLVDRNESFKFSIYFIHQQVVYKASKIEIEKRKRNKGLADSCITVTIVIDFDRRNK